ncbi:unnamed protein product, partial [Prorocentrum cordatum]
LPPLALGAGAPVARSKIANSAPARFALVAHLVARLLPMPLSLDNPEREKRCFWMQELRFETKSDIMRHIHLITRHFSAAALGLRLNREADGARVCVAAGLAAIMDALMRRPMDFLSLRRRHGGRRRDTASLLPLHYSGEADGPTKPFGLDPGVFREASEALLLVAPEYAVLRTLVLDYFYSIRGRIDDDHVIFHFDKSMACSEGDRLFVEQLGLCLGLDAPRRDAHLLLTAERPELIELYTELAWFRDVVFLWKVLLLPPGAAMSMSDDRFGSAAEWPLQWRWVSRDKVSFFSVLGFDGAEKVWATQPPRPTRLASTALVAEGFTVPLVLLSPSPMLSGLRPRERQHTLSSTKGLGPREPERAVLCERRGTRAGEIRARGLAGLP